MSRGGRGDLATTEESKNLDSKMKQAYKQLKEEFSGVFDVHSKISKNKWIEYFGIKPEEIGCEPDGGLWYLNGTLVAVFEGKYQGQRGNADERWYKNAAIFEKIFKWYNIKGIYYTLSSGYACRGKWRGNEILSNKIFDMDCRWVLKEDNFTYDEILDYMRNTLNEILNKNHKPHVYPEKRGVLDV